MIKSKAVSIITSVIVSVFLVAGFSFASDSIVNTVKEFLSPAEIQELETKQTEQYQMSAQESERVNAAYDEQLQAAGIEVDTTGMTTEETLIAKKKALAEQ
jgi:hypothetical protein